MKFGFCFWKLLRHQQSSCLSDYCQSFCSHVLPQLLTEENPNLRKGEKSQVELIMPDKCISLIKHLQSAFLNVNVHVDVFPFAGAQLHFILR